MHFYLLRIACLLACRQFLHALQGFRHFSVKPLILKILTKNQLGLKSRVFSIVLLETFQ